MMFLPTFPKYYAALALTAWAAFFSIQSAAADARIRIENYSENRVYTIYAKVGRATLVQLQDGEFLDARSSALGMGDAAA